MSLPYLHRSTLAVILCFLLLPVITHGAEPSKADTSLSSSTGHDTTQKRLRTSASDTRIMVLENRVESLVRQVQTLRRALRRAQQSRRALEQRVSGLENRLNMVKETMEVRGKSGHFQSVSRADFETIQEGMSSDRVRSILGPAHHVGTISYGNADSGTGEVWQYKVTIEDRNRTILIMFQGGQVDHKKLY